MELRHLRYFVAVADELNFTKAAEKLRLAQPSLTRQIHNLEDELGVRLLNRTKNRVSLTEEGRSFLIDARRLVEQSVASVEAVQRLSRGESSLLNLGYLSKFNFDLLPAPLAKFALLCPGTAVNLFDMVPAEQLRALQMRTIDLGFVGIRPPPSYKGVEGLNWERTSRHELVVVLPARHPLAKKSSIALKDLEQSFFVSMSEATHPGSLQWLRGFCQKEAGFNPKVLQDVETEADLLFLVSKGLGVTLARTQIRSLEHSGVVFRPLANRVFADYWIAWQEGNRSKSLLQYIKIVSTQAP